MSDSLDQLGLLFITQLVLTLYGAGLRRPFGSMETVADSPDWLRVSKSLVLALDILFVAFVLFMWWHLLHAMRLRTFLIAFFIFGAFGTLLSHHVNLIRSSAISLVGALLAIYVVLDEGS
jgi:hypothetical protein